VRNEFLRGPVITVELKLRAWSDDFMAHFTVLEGESHCNLCGANGQIRGESGHNKHERIPNASPNHILGKARESLEALGTLPAVRSSQGQRRKAAGDNIRTLREAFGEVC
jgi:hypothetical protein